MSGLERDKLRVAIDAQMRLKLGLGLGPGRSRGGARPQGVPAPTGDPTPAIVQVRTPSIAMRRSPWYAESLYQGGPV